MTNKRFTCKINEVTKKVNYFDYDRIMSDETVLKLLNNYFEGYEDLKEKYLELRKENHRLRLTLSHSKDLNMDIEWLKENLGKGDLKE